MKNLNRVFFSALQLSVCWASALISPPEVPISLPNLVKGQSDPLSVVYDSSDLDCVNSQYVLWCITLCLTKVGNYTLTSSEWAGLGASWKTVSRVTILRLAPIRTSKSSLEWLLINCFSYTVRLPYGAWGHAGALVLPWVTAGLRPVLTHWVTSASYRKSRCWNCN